jgi:hypothetical protein
MYRLVGIESAKSDDLFATVTNCLAENNPVIDNLIGISCDEANAVVGSNHSLSTILRSCSWQELERKIKWSQCVCRFWFLDMCLSLIHKSTIIVFLENRVCTSKLGGRYYQSQLAAPALLTLGFRFHINMYATYAMCPNHISTSN